MTGEYAAFISYRHRPLDTAVATRLHRLIEHYRIPKDLRQDGQKHVGRVFRDRDELPLSSDLTAELRAALDHSKFLIVICTPDTPQSIWVDREIEYFLRSHDRDNVLAVLAAGTQDVAFPKRLTEVYAADGVTVVEQVEPLAANIADETNPITPANWLLPHRLRVLWRLHGEFLRLMAALLHCPYDTLRQRQRLYILRRVLAATLAAAGVAAVFAGMLLDRNREIARQMTLAQQNEQRALASEAQAQENAFTAQKNESYTLGLLSAQQLADGDRITAIETALAGLPGEGETRPAHAAAEQALADALYLYQPTALRPAGTVKTDYDIEAACLSDDGSRLLLLDDAARTVHCYDTASTRLLWSTRLDDVLTRYAFTAFVPWQDEQEAFLYVSFDTVELLDLADGHLLAAWDIDAPAAGYKWTSACAVLPDAHTLVTVYEQLPGGDSLLLAAWDLWTGECLHTQVLPYGGPLFSTQETLLLDERSGHWALLVEDRDRDDTFAYQAVYAGTVRDWSVTWQQNAEMDSLSGLCGIFCPYGDLLVLRMEGLDAGDPVQVQRVDPDTGEQVFRAGAQMPWDAALTAPPLLFVWGSTHVLWMLDRGICQVSLTDGSLSDQTGLADTVLCARPAAGGGFAVVEQSGTLAALTGVGTSDAASAALYSQAGTPRAAAAAADTAAFCLLPQADSRTAVLYTELADTGYRLLPLPEEQELSSRTSLFPLAQDGSLAAVDCAGAADRILLYDAQLQPAQVFSFPWYTLPSDVCPRGLTGDGLLLCTTNTDAVSFWLDTASGQRYTLTGLLPEDQQVVRGLATPPGGATPWFAWLVMLESSDEDGPAFGLRYALAPQQAQEAPQPDGVRLEGGPLAIGGSGWAVTGGTLMQDGSACWAAFDTAAGQWQTVAMPETAYTDNLCVGDARPCFAALEPDGTCRLYDLAAGTSRVLAKLPGFDTPFQTVLRFADADRVLLVFLPGGTLYVLDTETGAVRLTADLPDLPEPFGPLVQVDEIGRDLYIADPSGALPGLCIDLEDWYLKWRREDFLCWLPASRELAFRSSEYSEGYAPRLYPAADVSELVARARALLAP